ncbi:MAG TPA: glycosyltransferase family 1 protein [Thermoanaerobaculia bacterium]|nr:glycosyltransferase family 1 protein [Thermoanaerobaculia bacterium]
MRAPTGIGVHTLEIAERLARRGDLELVGLAHRRPAAAERLESAGVRIEVQPAPLGVVWQQLALPRRLAAGDLDLLWSPLQTLPRRLPVPAIVTLHDLAALLWPETLSWKIRWSQVPFLAHSLERAARVVAVSHATARDLAAAFPAAAARTVVIWNGVGPAWRPGDADAVAATRERLGAPGGYFLSVGTLEPRKNLDLLLDAWEILRTEEPELELPLLLGGPEGWKHAELKARIAALAPAGVRHLGRLADAELRAVVQAATAFVYPSLYEGFGLPVAEAMACGVPVVVTASSSLPEVAGDAGLVVEPERPDELAHALLRLVREPGLAAELGGRGRERARRFSWDEAAERFAGLIHEVLDGRGERA